MEDGMPCYPPLLSKQSWKFDIGTVMQYLKKNPSVSPLGFVRDIIEGIYYLHRLVDFLFHSAVI